MTRVRRLRSMASRGCTSRIFEGPSFAPKSRFGVSLPQRHSRRCLFRCMLFGGLVPAVAGRLFAQPTAGNAFRQLFNSATRKAIRDGLSYLASQQNEDGSFGTHDYNRNVAVCSLCGMAFLANGSTPGRGRYGSHLRRTVEYVLEHCHRSGFISYREAVSRGPMYGHGFATLFLAEVYGMSQRAELREKLSKAVQLIVNTQNSEGGWRYEPRRNEADVSVTVCQVMALRAARNAGIHVPNETVDNAIHYIKRCQNPDGGFRYLANRAGESEFPRSAAAIVALYSAGIYTGDEIDRGLAYLMLHPPGSQPLAQESYFFYGHYYAVQAMWQAGGNYWRTWYPAVRDVLLAQQQKKAGGCWPDSISPEYGTAMACLVLQMPSNFLPIFQR